MIYKINNYKKIDQNLKIIINILQENKIKYWVCHGTLLGIIRDKKLIPWDHDIDIGVFENKIYRKLLPIILKKNGFKEIKKTFLDDDGMMKFVKKGGREVDINFYESKKKNDEEEVAYIKWYIPRNKLMKTVDAISAANIYTGKYSYIINRLSFLQYFFKKIKIYLIKKNYFHKSIGYTQPLKLLLNFKKINFKDLQVSVPYLSEEYLEYVYGPNWKKPIKKYNWIKDSPSTKSVE